MRTSAEASTVIARLRLEPHPEGGWFRETWRADAEEGARASGSAIYFLLAGRVLTRLHRIDADEIWHHYLGAPIELRLVRTDADSEIRILGPDISRGQCPQVVIPAGTWQQARSLGDYSLAGCTVSPAFDFSGFQLAND
ncbi:MAG TPA: cupin domain-containing protein [Chloroflexota bacterium]|nr:cupin domain-containing protein [Chloroflexota bacterium]